MRANVTGVAIVLGVLLAAAPAEANCSIAVTPVNFGPYDVFDTAPVDSTGAIVYNCNGAARNMTITLSPGQSATFNPRRMRSGTEPLSYNLFLDAARSVIWGTGGGATQMYFVGDPPNNRDVSVPIYGRVPAGQDVAIGSYTDNVTVTINF